VSGTGTGNDLLLGGEGRDELHGEDGDDLLVGGSGNDRLDTAFLGPFGGSSIDTTGDDVLVGGPGADLFGFGQTVTPFLTKGPGHDTVADFSRGDGDRIQLSYDRVASFGELLARVADGRIRESAGCGTLSLDFGGGDVLTIRGVEDLRPGDWAFAT
jgi:Ca2+-binding RTX toxin-like protein